MILVDVFKNTMCFLVLFGLIVTLNGCSNTKNLKEKVIIAKTEVDLYNEGMALYNNKKYKSALNVFNEISSTYPFSYWSGKSQLMGALASYNLGDYVKAAHDIDSYIQLHHNEENIEYAYYLRAIFNYAQIKDLDLDQTLCLRAIGLLNDFINLFPNSKYNKEITEKLHLLKNHIAGKDFSIGKFYLNKGQYIAAIRKFSIVFKYYGDSIYMAESLYRLAEAYLALGLVTESKQYVKILGDKFKDSHWYMHGVNLVSQKS